MSSTTTHENMIWPSKPVERLSRYGLENSQLLFICSNNDNNNSNNNSNNNDHKNDHKNDHTSDNHNNNNNHYNNTNHHNDSNNNNYKMYVHILLWDLIRN